MPDPHELIPCHAPAFLGAEEALRESEERYRVLFDRSPLPMFVYDAEDFRLLSVNDAAVEHYGFAREELLAMTFMDIRPEEEIPAMRGRLLSLGEERALEGYVARHRRKDGSILLAEVSNQPIVFDARPARIAVANDITERRRAEDALRESETRFRVIFEESALGIALVDAAGHAFLTNAACQKMLGYTGEELSAMSFEEFTHPDDRERERALFRELMAGAHEFYRMEKRYSRKDGEVAWASLTVKLVRNPQGAPQFAIGIVEDITERRLTEARLREQAALLDHARDAIIVQDLEGRLLFWSKGSERIFGWTAEEALGCKMQELLFEKPAEYLASLETVTRCGEWVGEVTKHAKEGRAVLIEGHWTLVRDETGAPAAVLSINTDITERKSLEAQFFRAQRLESIGMLAGGIAHDLNNILGPIIMCADLLKMATPAPRELEWIEAIEISARRGAEMVSHVLSFARGLEARRVVLRPADLFEEMRKITSETFPKSIALRIRVTPEVWNICGDATQLHQVLLNLCVNARDAMPGGGTLTLSADNLLIDEQFAAGHAGAQPGPCVVLEVADSGAGISPEHMGRIFDPFFTTKEFGKGTGLGLSTSLAIVKLYAGFITVESQPGAGTTFRVHLPAEPETAAGSATESRELPRGEREWILVIDDEAAFRSITRQTLEAFGYRVLTAVDGAEGVALFARHSGEIAVVLTDLVMPEMDGAAAARVILRLDPAAKIIGATGRAAHESQAGFANTGVQYFLPKPYTAEALLKMIHAILHPPH